MRIEHFNGEVDLNPKDVAWDAPFKAYLIMVQNTHAINALFVSFDGGVNFFTVSALARLPTIRAYADLPITFERRIKMRAGGANTTFEILALRD